MKKLICLLLGLTLVLSLFGCASGTDSSAQGSSLPSGEGDPAPSGPYTGAMPLVAEKETLSVFTHNGVSASMPPPDNDVPFWAYLEEFTNVTIDWQTVPWDQYDEIIGTRLASGVDLPDIMNANSSTMADNAGRNGLFLSLTDLIEEYGYYTKQWFEDGNDFTKELWTSPDGNIYAFGSYVHPTANQVVPVYNKLWLDQLGESIPTTTDEFLELCRKMKGVDFNGNGRDDEIILTAPGIYEWFNFSSSYGLQIYLNFDSMKVENGVVSSEFVNPQYKEYLQYLNVLYDEGILDPEIFSATYGEMYEKAAADRAGIIVVWSSFIKSLSNTTSYGLEHVDSEVYTVGVPLSGPYGDAFMIRRDVDGGDNTGITRDCKNPELAIKWLDALYAHPDVLETRYWGFEGQTYTVENGEKVKIMPEDGSEWNIQPLGCEQIPLPYIQSEEGLYNGMEHMQWYMDAEERLQSYFISGFPYLKFTDEEQEIVDAYRAEIDSYHKEMHAKFVSGQESFDNWDNYVAAMEGLQLNELVAAYQSMYDRTH